MGIPAGPLIALDPQGNVILGADFTSTVDVGTGPVVSNGGHDILVAKFDPTGAALWARHFGGPADDGGLAVAVDALGNIAVGGFISGTVDFGLGPGPAPTDGAFVLALDPQGSPRWARSWGAPSTPAFYGVAFTSGLGFDAASDVLVTGVIQSATDFGGGVLPGGAAPGMFLVKLDAQGHHVWSRRYQSALYAEQPALGSPRFAMCPSGDVWLAGSFLSSDLTFDATTLHNAATGGGTADAFLAKIGSDGATLVARSFGTPARDLGGAVACDATGGVRLTGQIDGAVDFGGGPLTVTQGYGNLYIARFDAAGGHVWSRASNCDGWNIQGVTAAVLDDGKAVVGGVAPPNGTTSCLDFGGGPLGTGDVWLVELEP